LPWVWDRVVFDVNCAPETVAEYRVSYAELVPAWYACTVQSCDDAGENCHDVPGLCVGYFLSPWQLGATEPDPGFGASVGTAWDVPTPELGAVFWLQVRAVDTAGNLDAGACAGP
jgi:hypothetical protein